MAEGIVGSRAPKERIGVVDGIEGGGELLRRRFDATGRGVIAGLEIEGLGVGGRSGIRRPPVVGRRVGRRGWRIERGSISGTLKHPDPDDKCERDGATGGCERDEQSPPSAVRRGDHYAVDFRRRRQIRGVD